MAKKRFAQRQAPSVANLNGPMTPEEFGDLLAAGDGLFWEKQGDQIKLHRAELVKMGIDLLWNMWREMDQMSKANNGTAAPVG